MSLIISTTVLFPANKTQKLFDFLKNNFKLLEYSSGSNNLGFAGWQSRLFKIEDNLIFIMHTSKTSSSSHSYYGLLPIDYETYKNKIHIINDNVINLDQAISQYMSKDSSKLFLFNLDLFT